ncbi:uncharacterized protein LOC134774456 [Penaeus indicus]|uniref:uncharacterized protein LOC134774456 n=1 Tax=Penaeus indicus TaxID=29960 RepID=UPI00300D3A5E
MASWRAESSPMAPPPSTQPESTLPSRWRLKADSGRLSPGRSEKANFNSNTAYDPELLGVQRASRVGMTAHLLEDPNYYKLVPDYIRDETAVDGVGHPLTLFSEVTHRSKNFITQDIRAHPHPFYTVAITPLPVPSLHSLPERTSSKDTMKNIFSRRFLFPNVVLAIVLLSLGFVGLSSRSYEERIGRPLEAKAVRDTAGSRDEGMVAQTQKRREGKGVYLLGRREKSVNKKVFAKEMSNRDALPSIEPSGGAALMSLDLAEYSPEDRAVLTGRLGVLRARASVVSRVCSSTPALFEMPTNDPFIWDTKHSPNIVWCPVYKVASTTWMNNFFILANRSKIDKNLPRRFNEARQKKEQRGINVSQSLEKKILCRLISLDGFSG